MPWSKTARRCFRAVDAMSDGSPKLIAIDKQPNHHVVHALCLHTIAEALDVLRPSPTLRQRAQVDMLALDLLRMCLPNHVLLCVTHWCFYDLHMQVKKNPSNRFFLTEIGEKIEYFHIQNVSVRKAHLIYTKGRNL
jgi:hypothetical protein